MQAERYDLAVRHRISAVAAVEVDARLVGAALDLQRLIAAEDRSAEADARSRRRVRLAHEEGELLGRQRERWAARGGEGGGRSGGRRDPDARAALDLFAVGPDQTVARHDGRIVGAEEDV